LAARGGEEPEMSEIQSWTGLTPGKEYRLQTMSIHKVAEDTSTIRSLDWDRDRFDIEFRLERGTTYNSYIIKGEKTALVDTSHEKFQDLYLAALQKELDLSTLDYLIVSHTEPDHSGLIGKVLEMAAEAGNDKLEVIGSKMCIAYLENLVFVPFKSRIVQNGVQLDLGGGHNLEFVIAPNLHWPDTMFTFDHKTGTLFTCDAFGMHYCSDHPEDVEGVKELLPHYATYYDCLMKPNARSVLTALGKIGHFDLKVLD
jgi:flavorubredoxin